MKKDSEQSNLAGRNDLIDDQDEPLNLQSENYLRSLLVDLEKGQLVDLLVDMGMQNPEVAEGIRAVASSDPPNRKLYVHGLSLGTTSESLCDAFSSHGEIEEAIVIFDKATGKSRGFGFITFKNVESVQEALQQPRRMIDGCKARCKLYVFRPPFLTTDEALRRLYVTGLSPDVSTEMFHSFFQKYGEIEEDFVVHDRETNTSRGIGFVTFKTDRGARRAINDPDKFLMGRKITVKNAWVHPKGKEKETHEEPVTYPTAISGYLVPHPAYPTGISGYPVPHPYASGIPSAYPTRISGYPVPHPYVSGNEPN